MTETGSGDPSPLRVLQAMASKGLGGIERAFITLETTLTAHGAAVTNLVQPGTPVLDELSPDARARTHGIRNHGQWDLWAVWRTARLIDQVRPDVLISHGRRPATLLRRAAALSKQGRRAAQVDFLHRYSMKHLHRSDLVISVSADLKREAEKAGIAADRVVFLPNMLPDDRPAAPPRPRPEVPVIGTLGRFVANKGFDVLIEAAEYLAARNVTFRLVIGGSGPLEAALKAQAEAARQRQPALQIEFVGWVSDQTGFFAGIDLLCIPSRWEPFGIVILEGFHHHRPVVAAAAIGPSEVINDGQDGLLVPLEAPEALAEALASLLNDPGRCESLVAGGQETLKRYRPDAVGPALVAALDQAVAVKRSV
ncbi:MAG: glycosyltransferase family 4 protein [Rhodospirillaceae bacterium]